MNEGLFQPDLAAVIQPQTALLKPESWMSKIDFINHLVLFNNMLITILADKKGGKTSFAAILQESLDPQIKFMVLTVRPPCNREEIINEIATQFHLNCDEHTDISSLVAQVNERRAHVLLMIDDAQHLPETFIKEIMLAIKNQENFSFFHLCLISDYSVVAALNSFSGAFFNDLVHTIELGPLSESEARAYVSQRARASRLITKSLTEAQLKQFYRLTQGNVAKINASLESFIFNSEGKKKGSSSDLIRKVVAPVGAALVSGAACLFITQTFYEDSAALASEHKEPVLESQIASWQDSATRGLIERTIAAPQNLDVIGRGLSDSAVVAAEHAVRHAKVTVPVYATAKKPKQLRSEGYNSKLYRLSKMATVDGNKLYTIQLVASPEKIDMKRYKIQKRMPEGTAKLNHYVENNVVWYVLTLGEFSTMSEAQKTISQLPPSLMKLNPWVRPIDSLG